MNIEKRNIKGLLASIFLENLPIKYLHILERLHNFSHGSRFSEPISFIVYMKLLERLSGKLSVVPKCKLIICIGLSLLFFDKISYVYNCNVKLLPRNHKFHVNNLKDPILVI